MVSEMLSDEMMVSGNFQDYFAYLPEMEKWQKEHPDVPFMNLYYEDMKQVCTMRI